MNKTKIFINKMYSDAAFRNFLKNCKTKEEKFKLIKKFGFDFTKEELQKQFQNNLKISKKDCQVMKSAKKCDCYYIG